MNLYDLYDDVLYEIIFFLEPEDVIKLGSTNKKLYNITNNDYIWKKYNKYMCLRKQDIHPKKIFFEYHYYNYYVIRKFLYEKIIIKYYDSSIIYENWFVKKNSKLIKETEKNTKDNCINMKSIFLIRWLIFNISIIKNNYSRFSCISDSLLNRLQNVIKENKIPIMHKLLYIKFCNEIISHLED
jgi:hypothetical protein